jgi:hypothetical protein
LTITPETTSGDKRRSFGIAKRLKKQAFRLGELTVSFAVLALADKIA